jgi:homoserine O-acetyltransferase
MQVREDQALVSGFRFQAGGTMDVRIRYATAGTPELDETGAVVNAVLLLHGTGSSYAALLAPDFEEALYGPGRPLDAAKHLLVFIDSLGHGASSKPGDGLRGRFPKYGYGDMVALQHRVVTQTLGIRKLRAVVGMSMGGMHAWMWAERHPDTVRAIVPVAATPRRIGGRNLLWRRIVARSIRADPDWREGSYGDASPRFWREVYPIVRMMADGGARLQESLTSLGAAEEFVQAAVDHAGTLDPNDLLFALEASEDYDPAPEKVRAEVLSVNFADDEFNPPDALRTSLARLPSAKLALLPGGFGHLAHGFPNLWAEELRALQL